MHRIEHQYICNAQRDLKESGVIEDEEGILGVFEEVSFIDTIGELAAIVDGHSDDGSEVVKVCSVKMYNLIHGFEHDMQVKEHKGLEVHVETKYKIVAKKVKHVALPLPT